MESYNTTVQYCAVVIENPEDTKKIKELVSNYVPSDGWSEPAHYHMTIAQGHLPESLRRRGDLNKEVEITINMIGISEKAIALGTFGYYSRNEMPHITVVFNKNNGGAPADSKEIDNWKPIDKIVVTGVIREVGEGNVVISENVIKNKIKVDFDDMDIKLGDKVVGDFYMYNRREKKYLAITKIEIYPEYQNHGYATQAMNQIIDYANSKNLIIILTPEAYKIDSVSLKKSSGMSTAQLTKWYKSFGFIMNKGKQKDFEHMHLMYKLPNSLDEMLDVPSGINSVSVLAYPGPPAKFPQEDDYDQFGNNKGSTEV